MCGLPHCESKNWKVEDNMLEQGDNLAIETYVFILQLMTLKVNIPICWI